VVLPQAATITEKAAAPAKATKARPADLRALLEKRAKGSKPAYVDLAVFLAETTPDRAGARSVEDALALAGLADKKAPVALLLVAARHAETADVRRRAAERVAAHARATAAERAEALALAGAYYAEESRSARRARELYAQALAADPDHWPAALRLARELAAIDLPETARRRVAEVVKAFPGARLALRELADLDRRRGRPEDAAATLEALVAAAQDEPQLRAELADLARARGDAKAAIAHLRAAVAADPSVLGTHLDLASALLDEGDLAGALAAWDAALLVAPDDPRALEASGRAMIDEGGQARRAEGIGRLARALAIRPANPELRQHLARVSPASDSDLERKYAKDARALIDRWANWNLGKDPSTVLLDLKVTRVHSNGLTEVLVQRVIRVDDENGAEAQRSQSVQYSPATQTVEIRTARVFKADGEVIEAKDRGVHEVSEPWYGLWYDVRAETVGFERLDAGDVIELTWVLADTGNQNLFADYFGDLHYFVEEVPRAQVEYVLLAPEARALYFQPPRLEGLVQEEAKVGAEKRYLFRAEKVAKLVFEGGMPGFTEVAPFLHVSTYRSWDEVARWYAGLIREQLVADDAVRKAARAAVKGLKDDVAKARAIHNLVVKSTRYVGLEFGIHGFQPYPVPQVFARKYGDCKDKASLMVVMMKEVGIDAHVVLVRTRKNGDIGEHPASLSVFDHAIAWVPAHDLWLDGTAEFSGSAELPAEDQGVTVLVIDGKDGKFTRTPVLDAAKNRFRRSYQLALQKGGGARLVEESEVTGQAAQEWRRYYQSAGDRRERYEKVWNSAFAGARLEKVEMPGLGELERAVTLRAEGTVPELGATATTGVARVSELSRAYARTSKRDHDLVLEYPWTQEERVEWRLPAGVNVATAPRAYEVSGDFGSFTMKVTEESQKLVVEYTLVVARRRITVAEYPKWREFLLAVDASLNQPLSFR
jgi:tetratricopeptide (TPR) repeat protein